MIDNALLLLPAYWTGLPKHWVITYTNAELFMIKEHREDTTNQKKMTPDKVS
jgi:hypothetical protein